MLGELQKKKFEYLYSVYDADKNGHIDFADFTCYVDRFSQLYNFDKTSVNYRDLTEAAAKIWDLIRDNADDNHDGRISLEEWMAFEEAYVEALQLSPDTFDYFCKVIKQLFDLVDVNNNGEISMVEYGDFLKGWGVDTDAEAIFSQLDIDGNGVLTFDEVIKHISDFYFSNDPKVPGNLFYGPYLQDEEHDAGLLRRCISKIFK